MRVLLIGFLMAACIAAGAVQNLSRVTTTTLDQIYFPVVVNQASEYWKPFPGTSWQIQLSGELNISLGVKLFDADLFETPEEIIDQLHGKGQRVICYFSAGSWEDWRSDADQFPEETIGNDLEGWPGEKWLDIRHLDMLGPIMEGRLDLAKQKGCDGVDPDNMDGFSNQSGFPLNSNDQLTYNIWVANQAHARGLAVGLKNDLDQVTELVAYFDWAINEQCFQYNECDLLLPFIQAGKPVFGIEYQGDPADFCPEANAMNFDFLKKNLNLDEWFYACR